MTKNDCIGCKYKDCIDCDDILECFERLIELCPCKTCIEMSKYRKRED